MSNDTLYMIPEALVLKVSRGTGEYAWAVILEKGHFQAQAVVLFETEVCVADAEWFGWLPGTGAVTKDIAHIPEEIECMPMLLDEE